jgi:4a-hydroxytetrahydrobiopterin dehydratase
MSRYVRLSSEEIQAALRRIPGWSLEAGKLHREYRFADFTHAFAFMAAAATVAEKLDHHPDWQNVYSRVTIDLWTHSENGITNLDVELASRLEKLAEKLLS